MTQAKIKFSSFADYLAWSNDPEHYLDGQFELIDGVLIEVPPKSGVNRAIATRIFFLFVSNGIVPLELIHPGQCEIQVPVLRPGDSANRYLAVVILDAVHRSLTQKRLTITLDMPPPQLVAEILSPGRQNRDRDLIHKRAQYAARGIPEYWLVDPDRQAVTVMRWENEIYVEVGLFQGNDKIISPGFPNLQLAAQQVFEAS